MLGIDLSPLNKQTALLIMEPSLRHLKKLFMCMCLCLCECMMYVSVVPMEPRNNWTPRGGVASSCELFAVGAGS